MEINGDLISVRFQTAPPSPQTQEWRSGIYKKKPANYKILL